METATLSTFKLTDENYFSQEALLEYFSVSQYKDFVGTYAMPGCEAGAMAKIRGEWVEEKSVALMVGSYVDAHFEGTLDVFKAQNPDIFTRTGDLKSEYRRANDIIARVEQDPGWMKYMAGEKQVIFAGELFGVKWKIKIDALLDKCITDLKAVKSLHDSFYVKDLGHHVSFVQYWGYDVQAAIYQEITRQNIGKKLPFFIAAVTKEPVPDHDIIGFTQKDLDDVISTIVPNINRISDLKKGLVEPDRCEQCDWCKATKVIKHPIHFSELIMKV